MFNRLAVRAVKARAPLGAAPRALRPLGSALLVAMAALAANSVVVDVARADAFTYASQRRQVRAAILVSSALNLPGRGGKQVPENPDPHVFYVLDARTDLKPGGMEFVNPLAPSIITPGLYQRWYDRDRTGGDPAFQTGSVFQMGARVTKNMGAYWEVNLDTVSADDLQQFDLLFIHTHKPNVTFAPDQVEKLRKYVEAGGTLWIDDCGGLTFNPATPFLVDIQYLNAGNSASQVAIAAPNHPLVTFPYPLSTNELANFGDKNRNDYLLYDPADGASPSMSGGNQVPGGYTMVPIVWNTRGQAPQSFTTPGAGWRPYVLAGQLGAGRVVFCAEDSGCAINDYVGGWNDGYGGNSGALSGEVLIGAHPVDMKFAYNLASWSAAHTTSLVNVHRTGGTDERIGAKLVEKWTPTGVTNPGTTKVGGAAFFRHCIYAVDGNLILHCYDSDPSEDLDGDGNPDDGLPDFLAGQSNDEVWNLDLKQYAGGAVTGASGPTVIEFYDQSYTTTAGATTNGLMNTPLRQLVLVTLSDGTVVAARALPQRAQAGLPLAPFTNVDWRFRLQTPLATDYGIDPSAPMTPPAIGFSEGVVFVSANTQNGGRVVALDPRWGKSAFHPGSDGLTGALDAGTDAGTGRAESIVPDDPNMPSVIGAPTAGYVRDVATGASDKMVYVHVKAAAAAGAQTLAETVRSYWFGTKGEPLVFEGGNNFRSRSTVPWYIVDPTASLNKNLALRQRVFFTYADPTTGQTASQELTFQPSGNPVAGQYSVNFPANRPVQVVVPGPLFQHNPGDEGVTVYASYTEDWSSDNTGTAKPNSRNTFVAPDPTASGSTLGGSPSLSTDDILYFTASTAAGAANAGRGILYAINEQPAPRAALKWAYVMHNGYTFQVNDQTYTVPPRLRQLDPILPGYGQPVIDVQFKGTPALREGVVYAIGRGSVGALPVSVLCAFKADPEITLKLGQSVPAGSRVRVGQINISNSQGVTTGGQVPVWLVENQNYTVDAGSGLVHITSMAPLGSTANFVSASMPFIVQIGNGPMQVVAGSKVDVLAGNTRETRLVGPDGVDNLLWYAVFPADLPASFGLSPGFVSSSPSVQGDILWLGTENGYIASFDADPSARDPQFQMKGSQVSLFTGAASHLRWWTQVGAPVLAAPVGAEGVLAVAAAAGVRTYSDTYTVVADAKRLVEVNAGGEAVWTCDGTRSYTVAGGDLPQFLVDPNSGIVNPVNPKSATGVPTVHKVPFARPAVVRRVGLGNFLVVDTGNNRVVQIDRGGNVVWEVTRLLDDYKHLLRPGDPLTLNEPSDCMYWTDVQPGIASSYVGSDGQTHTVTYANPVSIVHYLIADTGNFRVIEVVDIYDINGRPVQPVLDNSTPAPFTLGRQLNFVSSTLAVQGKQYRYRTVQRFVVRNGNLPASWQTPGKPADAPVALTLSVVPNVKLVGDTSQAQGALNTFGDTTEAGGGSLVVLNEAGTAVGVVSNLRLPDSTMPQGFRAQAIINPTWFSKFDELVPTPNGPQLVYKYLLCDANGCYQLTADTDPHYMNVEWMLSAADYFAMTGKRLFPSSIERLTSPVSMPAGLNGTPTFPSLHQYLITNRFSGEDDPTVFGLPAGAPHSEFHGEVFTVNPYSFTWAVGHGYVPDYSVSGTTLAPRSDASINWRCPSETPRTINGTFAGFSRLIGDPSTASSTSLLEQPAFADRPF